MVNLPGVAPQKRSLDRLKALDSLPGIQEKLGVAEVEAITSPDRASMVARWLLEKLKKPTEFVESGDAWILLAKAFRCLPPQKLAVLLSANNIIDIYRNGIDENVKSPDICALIVSNAEDLFGMACRPDAEHLEATLRNPADKVAALLHSCLRARVLQGADCLLSLSPALQFWDRRKVSPKDDDIFTDQCLAWAAKHLQQFPPLMTSRKRTIHETNSYNDETTTRLRKLLAKHFFLPARISFFNEQGTAVLELKMKALSTDSVFLKALPNLLNIAVSLVPVTTPKQRKEESRWVEAVFMIMLSVLADTSKEDELSGTVLSLLQVCIDASCSLSYNALSDVITDWTKLLESDSSNVNWQLLYTVMKLNSSILTEDPFTTALFEKLPKLQRVSETSESVHPHNDLANQVLRSYASQHRMQDYLIQIEKQAVQDPQTPWVNIPLAIVIHEIPLDLLQGRIEKYKNWLGTGSETEETLASINLLRNLLNSPFSDDIWALIYESCGEILQASLDLVRSRYKGIGSTQVWKLARTAFELWFPLWVGNQSANISTISEMGQSILSCKRVRKAIEKSKDAAEFYMIICQAFKYYPTCTEFCQEMVRRIVDDDEFLSIALAVVPSLAVNGLATPRVGGGGPVPPKLLEYILPDNLQGAIEYMLHAYPSKDQNEACTESLAKIPLSLLSKDQQKRSNQMIEYILEPEPRTIPEPAIDFCKVDSIVGTLQTEPSPSKRRSLLHAFRAHFAQHPEPGLSLNIAYLLLEKQKEFRKVGLEDAGQMTACYMALLLETLSAIDERVLEEPDGKARAHDLFARLIEFTTDVWDYRNYRRTTDCVLYVLEQKRFMVNQHGVEETLAIWRRNLKEASNLHQFFIFFDACKILTIALQKHEHRLQGRFHLVTLLLQELWTKVLTPWDYSLSDDTSLDVPKLKLRQANVLCQVTRFFASPRQRGVVKKSTAALSDKAGKAKSHVGDFVRYVVQHYCAEVLKHPPNDEIKKALTPALWAMIEAIETGGQHGIESLSAAMNNNQRGIFRGLYDEWKTFGKWRPSANDG